MKIYTKTGDRGETSLFTGERVSKNDPFMHALGTVDECNSTLGLARCYLPEEAVFQQARDQLEMIQHALFDLGAALATPRSRATSSKLERTRFDDEAIKTIEQWIDAMDATLPPLKAFILPGGHSAAATLHLARAICRRAERNVVYLQSSDVYDRVIIYLNRLSDYLFTLARYINTLSKSPETIWKSHKGL